MLVSFGIPYLVSTRPTVVAMQLQVIRDPMRPPPTREPQRDDAPLGRARQLVRGRQRLRAAVRQRQPGPTPIHPPFRCRWRALKPLRSTAKRPSITSYQQGKTPAPLRSQRSISVSHGDLRFRDASVVTHILAGGLLYVTCSQPLGEVQLASTHLNWIEFGAEIGWDYYILDEGWAQGGRGNVEGMRDWWPRGEGIRRREGRRPLGLGACIGHRYTRSSGTGTSRSGRKKGSSVSNDFFDAEDQSVPATLRRLV